MPETGEWEKQLLSDGHIMAFCKTTLISIIPACFESRVIDSLRYCEKNFF